eukprot:1378370-Alexandrium_andersonii.AAC.1
MGKGGCEGQLAAASGDGQLPGEVGQAAVGEAAGGPPLPVAGKWHMGVRALRSAAREPNVQS